MQFVICLTYSLTLQNALGDYALLFKTAVAVSDTVDITEKYQRLLMYYRMIRIEGFVELNSLYWF